MLTRMVTKRLLALGSASSFLALTACTGQLPGSFRLAQLEESFQSSQNVDTKLDMLWVIDNSASMDVSQQKLRDGFRTFAANYMKPTWDIRVAVITTDSYLAHPAFTNYLNSTITASGFHSNYLDQVNSGSVPGRVTSFVNPSWAAGLVNTSTGTFTRNAKVNEIFPKWNSNWSKLLPGTHDGPMTTLCYEGLGYFLKGQSRCYIRDDETANTGPSHCLNPGMGESSVTQCVNTTMNDTIHSGLPFVSTMPPSGTPADAAWTNALVDNFLINLSSGSSGSGSERGFASMLQLLADNEPGAGAFFRKDSLRVVVFVGDEDDQSMTLPSPVPGGFTPFTDYSGGCASKTVDGYTYTLSSCANPAKLIPVASVKSQLDTFFQTLDNSMGVEGATPNYFVVSIVALTGTAIQQLHSDRCTEEMNVFGTGSCSNVSVDRADRFIALGNLVGNGSLAMNIAESDYSPMLTAIGNAVVSKKAVFTLSRAATGEEDMVVSIKHADGSVTVIPADKYTVSGKILTITDLSIVLGFASTDKVVISYQPKTVF